MGSFDDKVVLVTGGNSGIGKVTACAFAKEGAYVVIAARRKEAGLEVVEKIAATGGKAGYIQCDVTQGPDVEQLVRRTVEIYGRLDVAFNNAGTAGDKIALADMSEAQFDQIVNLNIKGTWWCMKYEIQSMLQSGGGCFPSARGKACGGSQRLT